MTRTALAFSCMALLAAAAIGQVAQLPRTEKTTQGEFVFVGKVTSAVSGLASMSDPPRYQFTVKFDVLEMIKGDKPESMVLRFITTDDKAKVLQAGAKVLVTAKDGRAQTIVEGTDEAIKAAGGKSTATSRPASGPAATQPAASQPAAKAKTDPAGLPVEARLIVKKDTYVLKADQAGEAFTKKLDEIAKSGGQPPNPPEVEMSLELVNTGKESITVSVGGDSGTLVLKLEGPGAVTVPFTGAMSMDFKMGTPTNVEPGKALTIPITKLLHGARGIGEASDWTKPGTYTVTASYVTTIQGLGFNDQQTTTATAAPVTVRVTDK